MRRNDFSFSLLICSMICEMRIAERRASGGQAPISGAGKYKLAKEAVRWSWTYGEAA